MLFLFAPLALLVLTVLNQVDPLTEILVMMVSFAPNLQLMVKLEVLSLLIKLHVLKVINAIQVLIIILKRPHVIMMVSIKMNTVLQIARCVKLVSGAIRLVGLVVHLI